MNEKQSEKVGRMRVVKKLEPTSRGAIKLAEQFGKSLICVRHRVDAKAKLRFTTVELVVAKAPIKIRSNALVSVRIDWNEGALRRMVQVAGAKWDGQTKRWRMPKRLAGILRLADRIERE